MGITVVDYRGTANRLDADSWLEETDGSLTLAKDGELVARYIERGWIAFFTDEALTEPTIK